MLTDELIARRPTGRAGLADWYAEVLRAQREEGLTTADLATLIGVTSTNIYYWRKRLRELNARASDSGKANSSGLVRVAVRREPSVRADDEPSSGLEVRLARSRSIAVPPGFDPAELQRLVVALEAC